MNFLLVIVTFYDAVNMIHYVIRTANPFPHTAKFLFVGVRNNKTLQIRQIEYIHSVVVYQKDLTRLGEMIIFGQGSKTINSPNLVRYF